MAAKSWGQSQCHPELHPMEGPTVGGEMTGSRLVAVREEPARSPWPWKHLQGQGQGQGQEPEGAQVLLNQTYDWDWVVVLVLGLSPPVKKTEGDSPPQKESPRLGSFTQPHRPIIAVHSGQ